MINMTFPPTGTPFGTVCILCRKAENGAPSFIKEWEWVSADNGGVWRVPNDSMLNRFYAPSTMGMLGWFFVSLKDQKNNSLDSVLEEIGKEVAAAEALWPPMNSAHEAYAVLLEEVDELWDHVKTNQKRRDLPAMRKEALQVAAMAVRFVRDICNEERGRK